MSRSPSFPVAKLVPLSPGDRRPGWHRRAHARADGHPRAGRSDLATDNRGADLAIADEVGENGWIVASIPEVAGVFSQGRTRAEARANVLDALRLMRSPEQSAMAVRPP
jgi:hypothetical protein